MTSPSHIPFDQWTDHCFDTIALIALRSGVSAAQAREDGELVHRLITHIAHGPDVVAFPRRIAGI